MSKKGERNQELQQGKAEKAYGGYLPSVMNEGLTDRAEITPERGTEHGTEKLLNTPS